MLPCGRGGCETGSVFTGGSGGGCVFGRAARGENDAKGSFVVAFLPDTGMRYLTKCTATNDARARHTDSEVPLTPKTSQRETQTGKGPRMIVAGPAQTVSRLLQYHADAGHFAVACVRKGYASRRDYEDQILNLRCRARTAQDPSAK